MRKRLILLGKAIKSQRSLNNLLRYHPIYYRRVARTLSQIDQAQGHHREVIVKSLLADSLKRAQNTPYGKGRGLDVTTWPILEKKQVKENPKEFQTNVLPFVPAATSGSGGVPLKLKRGLLDIAAEQACLDSLMKTQGISFHNSKVAVLRGDFVKPPGDKNPPFGEYRDRNYIILSLPHLNELTLPWFVEELQTLKPHIFWVYPTGADYLASLCNKHQIHIPIPIVLSSSEMLMPQARERIHQAFGSTVIDYYGQAERVCLSYQSKVNEAWFHPGYGHVELHPVDEPAVDGLRRAKIVATGYWKAKMPLVRYNTGDFISYPSDYKDSDLKLVSLGLKPFTRIEGRQSEYLLTPTGERIQALNNIPYEVDHLRKVQFIQNSLDEVEVRLDTEEDFNEDDLAVFMKNARAKISDKISIKIKKNVPLITTKAGKTPFLIRNITNS